MTQNYKNYNSYEEFKRIIELGIRCNDCAQLLYSGNINMFDHEHGIPVPDKDKPQWVSILCVSCDYDWSWWKIVRMSKRK